MVDEKYLLDQFQSLSVGEMEVMKLLVEGCSSSYIRQVMFLSPRTLSQRQSKIYAKLGFEGRQDINSKVMSVLMYQKWELLRKA